MGVGGEIEAVVDRDGIEPVTPSLDDLVDIFLGKARVRRDLLDDLAVIVFKAQLLCQTSAELAPAAPAPSSLIIALRKQFETIASATIVKPASPQESTSRKIRQPRRSSFGAKEKSASPLREK